MLLRFSEPPALLPSSEAPRGSIGNTGKNIKKQPNPAPGFRDAGINGGCGTLVSVGNNGFNYSASVSGNNGIGVHFGTKNLNIIASDRAYGLQLRCLSE